MITAIIIDDEQNSIETLSADLKRYCPQIDILERCLSAKDGLKAIRIHEPELVFLDIHMPWMSGIELLEVLGSDLDFDVIFTTAHDQYAVAAFRLSAIDYLLKPIDPQELISAVEKVSQKNKNISSAQVQHLKENLNPSSSLQRLGIPTKDGIEFVLIKDVLYCEAESNYTHIYLSGGQKMLTAKTLKEFDKLLSDSHFCRIHQSFLINLNQLKKYFRGDGGYVLMQNDASLPVSRSKKGELLSKIKA